MRGTWHRHEQLRAVRKGQPFFWVGWGAGELTLSDTVETLSFNLEAVEQITVTSKMDADTFAFFKENIRDIYHGRISHSTLEKDSEDESENGKNV